MMVMMGNIRNMMSESGNGCLGSVSSITNTS